MIKLNKKNSCAVAFAAALCAAGPAYSSGLPVVDGAALAQAVLDYINAGEQLTQLQQTLQINDLQLSKLKEQFDSLSGNRGFADAIKTFDDLDDFLIAGGGFGNLSTDEILSSVIVDSDNVPVIEAQEIYDEMGFKEKCRMFASIEAQYACKSFGKKMSMAQAAQNQRKESSKHQFETIQKLGEQISETEDIKGIAEVQARLTQETATQQAITNQILINMEEQRLMEMKIEQQRMDSQREALTPSQEDIDMFIRF